MRTFMVVLSLSVLLAFARVSFAQEKAEPQKVEHNRFAFEVNYVPYYSGDLYSIHFNHYALQAQLINKKVQFTALQAQWHFFVMQRLSLMLSVGYNGYTEKQNFNYERDYPPYDSLNQDEYAAYYYSNSLKQWSVGINLRYYLLKRMVNRVAPFLQLGISKKFASGEVTQEMTNSQTQENNRQEKNNIDDFLRDFNSPFSTNFGFGAEYYFNKALALNGFIMFNYAARKGTYKYQLKTEDYTEGSQTEFKRKDFQTQIGLGLAFYF